MEALRVGNGIDQNTDAPAGIIYILIGETCTSSCFRVFMKLSALGVVIWISDRLMLAWISRRSTATITPLWRSTVGRHRDGRQ